MKAMLACSTIPKLEQIDYPVMASPKLDGIRCIIQEDGKAYSRNGKLIPNEHVQKALQDMKLPVCDGELMTVGDFNDVQSNVMSAKGEVDFVYNVFDCPGHMPFCVRFKQAETLVHDLNDPRVTLVPQVIVSDMETLQHLWATAEGRGWRRSTGHIPDQRLSPGSAP